MRFWPVRWTRQTPPVPPRTSPRSMSVSVMYQTRRMTGPASRRTSGAWVASWRTARSGHRAGASCRRARACRRWRSLRARSRREPHSRTPGALRAIVLRYAPTSRTERMRPTPERCPARLARESRRCRRSRRSPRTRRAARARPCIRQWCSRRLWSDRQDGTDLPSAFAASRQLRHHAPRDERDVRRAFSQPAHEVGIPLRAERHIDTHAIALPHELLLEVAPYTVEHLELEPTRIDAVRLHEGLGGVDDARIVRGDAGVIPVR